MKTDKEVLELVGKIKDNDLYFPDLLKQCCSQGGIAPFVGAGLSAPFGFPLWKNFLLEIADSAYVRKEVEKMLEEMHYEEAASLVQEKIGDEEFETRMERAYGDERLPAGLIQGAAACLPEFRPGPIITTNFDRLIERVFDGASRPIEVVWRTQAERGSAALQQGRPILVKLHGDWQEKATRVLTHQQYEATYGSLQPEKLDTSLPIPSLLNVLLATRAFLFIGCSLAQDRTMQVLAKTSEVFKCKHYALLARPTDNDEFLKRRRELSDLHIRPIWYPQELRDEFIPALLAFLAAATRKISPQLPARSQERRYPKGVSVPELPIVGRTEEIREISGLLRGLSLVTIVGAGGCGKSRIAIEVARELAPAYEDRVWFIELADLSPKADREELLPSRIGRVVGVPQQPSLPPLDVLAAHFKDQANLLLLDNCEHLIESCTSIVTELLKRCPGLKVLATSRRRLGLRAEQVYPLGPLRVPEGSGIDLSVLKQNESIVLFMAHARKLTGNFEITEGNARPVAELCRVLDGIPLALELAAVGLRLNSTSPENALAHWRNLVASIRNQSDQLDSTGARHWQTLSAALEWSYQLVSEPARGILQILAIFDGGWIESTARNVCEPFVPQADAIPDLLHELLENSLTSSREINGSRRFRLLEPVRQFVRLKISPEAAKRHSDRHAEVFTRFIEEAAPKLLTEEQAQWLDHIQYEVDNLRAAMRWAMEQRDARTALRIAGSVWRFMEIRGYYTEGRQRLREAIALQDAETFPSLLQRTLSGAGWLAYRQSDYADAKSLLERALAISEREHDDAGIANALNDLANINGINGHYAEAREKLLRCLEIERGRNNRRAIAAALYNLGAWNLAEGGLEEAGSFLLESVYEFRQAQNLREAAFPLRSFAELALHRDQLELARNYADESLEIRVGLKDSKGQAEVHCTLARIELASDQCNQAADHLDKCLGLARAIGDIRTIVDAFEVAALLHFRLGATPLAVELLAAADRSRKRIGYAIYPVRQAQYDRLKADLQSRATEADFKSYWERGLVRETNSLIDAAIRRSAVL